MSCGKAENATRFPLSHSFYHYQSGKDQPGHEWKASARPHSPWCKLCGLSRVPKPERRGGCRQ